MAGFTERVQIIIDVVTEKSGSALSKLKSDIGEAEGALGKIKAGAGGIVSALGPAGIAGAAVGAAGAIGAFAVKSIQKFEETALAADKFRDSTGMSLDDSSRWIAVADDVGVSAGTIQTAFQKMEKAIASNRQAFGDLVVTAKDGSVDLSATFLNAIQHIQSIKDPIDQQREAVKLFGKGFSEVSQIIGTDADTLREKLKGVSDAQLINEDEVRKAREFQAAQDDLSDSIGDFEREVGSALIPAVSRLTETAATAIQRLDEMGSKISWIKQLALGFGGEVDVDKAAASGDKGAREFQQRLDELIAKQQGVSAATIEARREMENFGTAMGPASNSTGDFVRNVQAASGEVDTLGVDIEVTGQKVDDLGLKFDLLRGKLSVKDAQLSLADGFQQVEDSAVKAWEATASGATDAAEKVRDHEKSVNDLEQKVVDYGEKVLGLPPEVVSDILAKIDEGDLAGAKAALDKAAEARTAAFKAKEDTGATSAVERAFENAARTRSAVMNAQAQGTENADRLLNSTARGRSVSLVATPEGLGAADRALDNVARTRTVSIITNLVNSVTGAVPHKAAGGMASGLTVVGERGPELVDLPGGSNVVDAERTANILEGGSSTSTAATTTNITNVNVHFPPGTDPAAVARATERYRQRNGSR